MIVVRPHAGSRRANTSLSPAHIEHLRVLTAKHGVVRIQQMLRCSQHLYAELRSGGFAMAATVARVEAAIDALREAP